jgi:hypothetical protein
VNLAASHGGRRGQVVEDQDGVMARLHGGKGSRVAAGGRGMDGAGPDSG